MRTLDGRLALAMLILFVSSVSGCGKTHCEITCSGDGFSQTTEGPCKLDELIQLETLHGGCVPEETVEDDF